MLMPSGIPHDASSRAREIRDGGAGVVSGRCRSSLCRRVALLALVFVFAVLVASTSTATSARAATSPRQMKAIVHAWSNRLNAGDNVGVAHLFRLPAILIQSDAFLLHTYAQLAEWHSLLPCAGHITSIVVKGRFATAVFRLGDREHSRCDAPGALVAARFEIVRGKIVSWQQVPVPEKQRPPTPNVA